MSKTQKELILEHLERGWSITSHEAWEKYGCSRLADVIFKLRKEGYRIDSEMTEGKTRLGAETHYATYRLVVM